MRRLFGTGVGAERASRCHSSGSGIAGGRWIFGVAASATISGAGCYSGDRAYGKGSTSQREANARIGSGGFLPETGRQRRAVGSDSGLPAGGMRLGWKVTFLG